VNNSVAAWAELPNGDLAAGGVFSLAGGIAANSIARWDGVALVIAVGGKVCWQKKQPQIVLCSMSAR